MHIYKYMEV